MFTKLFTGIRIKKHLVRPRYRWIYELNLRISQVWNKLHWHCIVLSEEFLCVCVCWGGGEISVYKKGTKCVHTHGECQYPKRTSSQYVTFEYRGSLFYLPSIGSPFRTARLSYQRNPLRRPPTHAAKQRREVINHSYQIKHFFSLKTERVAGVSVSLLSPLQIFDIKLDAGRKDAVSRQM